METIVENAQLLVHSLLGLMSSLYQRASLEAQLGLFLEAQGHSLPQHTQLKSASSLSRFLNQYIWSTLSVIRSNYKFGFARQYTDIGASVQRKISLVK